MTTTSRGMKISRHVREYYEAMVPRYRSLESIVSKIINSFIEPRWHYEQRIKSRESFTLKLETARYCRPEKIDDLLAGTIVVENSKIIEVVRSRVARHFDIKESRPKDISLTHKQPYAFEFDDLRLYLTLPEESPHYHQLGSLVFELQIKTYLQHAWGIATHDMIFKGDAIDWSLSRIAFQVKAMLEHAEASIEAADQMVEASCLSKTNQMVQNINSCVDLLKAYWIEEQLPFDLRRLAENILTSLKLFGKSIDELDTLLACEAAKTIGWLPLNLSPYLSIIQVLLHSSNPDLLAKKNRDKSLKIVVTPDIEAPVGIDLRRQRNVIFVDSSLMIED